MTDVKIEVRCIGCGTKRIISRAESARLSESRDVPICDDCFMPMIVSKVRA